MFIWQIGIVLQKMRECDGMLTSASPFSRAVITPAPTHQHGDRGLPSGVALSRLA
jgi:hypothetical protein